MRRNGSRSESLKALLLGVAEDLFVNSFAESSQIGLNTASKTKKIPEEYKKVVKIVDAIWGEMRHQSVSQGGGWEGE